MKIGLYEPNEMSENLAHLNSTISHSNGLSSSVGNYKGVMLCNRPFGSSLFDSRTGKLKSFGSKKTHISRKENMKSQMLLTEKPPFISGSSSHEQLGLHKPRHPCLAATQREQKTTVTMKQKQHLKEMKEKREEYAQKENLLQNKTEQKRLAFRQKMEEQRKLIVAERRNEKDKPAWAMTEEEAKDSEEDKVKDLLSFVKELDFESYIEDLEVKTALDSLRDVVLAKQKKEEDEEKQKNKIASTQESTKLSLFDKIKTLFKKKEHTEEAEPGVEGTGDCDDTFDLQSVVTSLSQSQANIHSKKSLTELVKREVKGDPLINCVKEDDGNRLKNTKLLSKLPYMHRNPAI